ncbi:PF04342 family protein [Leptospira wolbachii serovar Codice str. CDC]|uniref:PF04342 family protein n=1 Tax=Leptospira wolbachii serovar Codice str. CDC TaxID=1218599 RepID=R8ZZA6_9LEPT|nr:DMT family protein [Leptospira wolbachii]EOQ95202.1 PF04342 family protein [Leptospira wolbachii serovar Codice str. CDC]
MTTIALLILSNIFMTFAWYGHLKFAKSSNMFYIILFSWGIAFFEYVLMVPANRIGYTVYKFEGFQLKIIQEVITIFVFILFATLFLGERLKWNYIVSFGLILLAGYFAFGFGNKSNGH